jgi:ATP adenylyltransferase
MEYIEKHKEENGCVFCEALGLPDGPQNLIVHRAPLTFVIINRYPYTSGHLMVVPYAHEPSLEGLEASMRAEIMELAIQSMAVLRQVYHPQGFNIGINIGEPAGAGILDHVHLHIVPRWTGDTNFMSSLGQTRVLPETLEDTWERVRQAWLVQFK